MPFDAVLCLAFGGPQGLRDVRPFLDNVLRGRQVSPARLDEVIRHYEVFDGRSPLNQITLRQASALQDRLAADGPRVPVHVGMRNWHPYIGEALETMAGAGIRRAVGLVLSAQQSEAGWGRYQQALAEARAALGQRAPAVELADAWYDHPLFVEAVADRTRQALARFGRERRSQVPLIFTAHSVPQAGSGTAVYVRQVEVGARQVAVAVGNSHWSVAYQSRSGPQGAAWLEPDIGDALRRLSARGARAVAVVPIGFVCDHIEVLYDLDTEARRIAESCGITMVRTGTVGDHPVFVRMLADVVRRRMERD